jgi:septum formation protein
MIISSVPIILASQSPRRSQLLKQIGLEFAVHPSRIAEIIIPERSFPENVRQLALQKAMDVSRNYTEAIVIGSDTIVVIDDKVLGKPSSAVDAEEMLSALSGKTHTVFTGFAFVDAGSKKSYIDFEQTEVTFRPLSSEEITDYINSGSPMDKAGAYGIQDDFGAVFVEKIVGDYYTVVGFPISKFYVAFREFVKELQS